MTTFFFRYILSSFYCVRELGNVIERALILNPTGPLTFEHLNLGQPEKLWNYGDITKKLIISMG